MIRVEDLRITFGHGAGSGGAMIREQAFVEQHGLADDMGAETQRPVEVGNDDRVHVMMVSVDPDRDDLESLGEYVTSFGDDFLGATGDISDIERVATEYGVFFARGDDTLVLEDGGGEYDDLYEE